MHASKFHAINYYKLILLLLHLKKIITA